MEGCLAKVGLGNVSKLMGCGFSDVFILTIVSITNTTVMKARD